MKAYDIIIQAALIAGETYLNNWWEDDGEGRILCDTVINLPTADYLNKAWLYNFLLPERTGAENYRTAYQVSDYALAEIAYQLGDGMVTEWRSRLTLETTEVEEQATKYVAAQFLICKDLDPQTLLDALNDALDEIGPITQYNTDLVTVADQEDYSLAQADESTVVTHAAYAKTFTNTTGFSSSEDGWIEAPAGFARYVHAPVRTTHPTFGDVFWTAEWSASGGRTNAGCLHAYGPRNKGGVDEDNEAIWYMPINAAAVVGHTVSAWFKGTKQSTEDAIPYPFARIWYTNGTYTEQLHTPSSSAFDWVQVTATVPQSAAGKTVLEYQIGVYLAGTGSWNNIDRDIYIDDASWDIQLSQAERESTYTQAAATPARNIVRVEVGQAASDPYGWQINRYWRESGASGTANTLSFYADHAPSESGLPIRVWFNAPHPTITSMSDDILPEVYAPRLIWTTAYHAARRLARARTYDRERYADLLKQCDLRRQEMKVRYPTRNLVKDPEFTR